MSEFEDITAEVGRDVARNVILSNVGLLIHDLSCNCAVANLVGASAALQAAQWSVRDMLEAWYEGWLGND